MYHLQAPRIFLEQGRLSLLPDIWQANGPMAVEMLFAIGLAFGRDAFAQLIHVSCAVLLVTGVFILGRRYLGKMGGWVAAALFAGVPVLPLWAASAQVDVAWALFEFWHYLLSSCGSDRGTKMACAGWYPYRVRPGDKYLAISGGLVLGFCVFAFSFKWGFRSILKTVCFTVLFLFWSAPLVSEKPVPGWQSGISHVLGRPGMGFRAAALADGLSAGLGRSQSLLDYLLLPLNVYSRHARFVLMGIEIPGFLYPLALFYPLLRWREMKQQASRKRKRTGIFTSRRSVISIGLQSSPPCVSFFGRLGHSRPGFSCRSSLR
jgi:hypothetical protein